MFLTLTCLERFFAVLPA